MSKVLRTLLERFSMKVLAVEETHDLKMMELDELLGSLRTYEMNLKEKRKSPRRRPKELP